MAKAQSADPRGLLRGAAEELSAERTVSSWVWPAGGGQGCGADCAEAWSSSPNLPGETHCQDHTTTCLPPRRRSLPSALLPHPPARKRLCLPLCQCRGVVGSRALEELQGESPAPLLARWVTGQSPPPALGADRQEGAGQQLPTTERDPKRRCAANARGSPWCRTNSPSLLSLLFSSLIYI